MSERPDIVPIGHIPELGVIHEQMHAYVVRPERFGEPKQSFEAEAMPVEELARGEVLVRAVGPGVDDHEVGLIGAPRPGLRNLGETRAAAANG